MATARTREVPDHNLVQFRLPPGLLKQLDDLALSNDETRGDCAKRILIEAMTQAWLPRLQERLDASNRDIHELRVDLATTVKAMLVEFAKEDPSRVDKWVREHLLK